MSSNLFTPLVVLLILGFLSVCIEVQAPSYQSHYCPNTTNFTPNSSYQSNLNLLLSSLTFNATSKNGFYYTIAGVQNFTAEVVYGSFLCRGDLTPDMCKECVTTVAKHGVQKYCPSGKIAILWYNYCMLRYTNESFINRMDEAPRVALLNIVNVSDPTKFMQLLAHTMSGLVDQASNAPSGAKKYATKEADFTGFQKLYSLVQCTPDLSSTSCDRCLQEAVIQLPGCCTGKQGGSVLLPSCNVQYEVYPFYTPEAAASSPPPALSPLPLPPSAASSPPPALSPLPLPPSGHASNTFIVMVASVCGFALLSTTALAIFDRVKQSKRREEKENRRKIEKFLDDHKSHVPTRYSYADIKKMTNGFKKNLGEGGFGSVFSGKLPSTNGVPVAVKVLKDSKGTGEDFVNEVGTIGRIHHVNVVRLLGFSAEGGKRALIYELMPNGSLEKFITSKDQPRDNNASFNWMKLHNIITGIAKGIEYLHQGCGQRILHFDIKPHNILLDHDFNPKISDFGLAKLCSKEHSLISMTAARGTIGYIAPEVFNGNFGTVSYKSDVYSFGMLVLEAIGARKVTALASSNSELYFPELIYKSLIQGEDLNLELADDEDAQIAKRLAIVALWCIQWYPVNRPSMKGVLRMLEGASESLIMPPNPFASTTQSEPATSLPT